MPMPLWFGHINKRIFNPSEIEKGLRPVLSHTGRASGQSYRTPLDAYRVDGGYIFMLVYGSSSDWVKNVLAAGTAVLRIDGGDIDLDLPKVITKDVAWRQLPDTAKAPPKMVRVTEYLQMQVR